jgi:hypothetical protein
MKLGKIINHIIRNVRLITFQINIFSELLLFRRMSGSFRAVLPPTPSWVVRCRRIDPTFTSIVSKKKTWNSPIRTIWRKDLGRAKFCFSFRKTGFRLQIWQSVWQIKSPMRSVCLTLQSISKFILVGRREDTRHYFWCLFIYSSKD